MLLQTNGNSGRDYMNIVGESMCPPSRNPREEGSDFFVLHEKAILNQFKTKVCLA